MRRTATIVALMLAGALAVGTATASATPASTVTCGQTLTHSVRLANDLSNCPGDGLVIGAPGVTVDLNGHTIDGVATQIEDCDVPPFGSAGIQNSGGYDGLTIKNGTLSSSSTALPRARTRRRCPIAGSCTSSPATTASAA